PEDRQCPDCGSPDRDIQVWEEECITITEETRIQQRHGEPRQVRPHAEIRDERKWNFDRERFERRRMVIDRENNRYEQTWHDEQTGEQTFHKSGRLDDPDVHGVSARRQVPQHRDTPDATS
ncbi:MAG: hypothetical protein WCG47_12570, partial [Dermatophilaceae bacterium]